MNFTSHFIAGGRDSRPVSRATVRGLRILLALAVLGAGAGSTWAQNTRTPQPPAPAAPAPVVKKGPDAVWSAYYAGRYAEAIKLAEPMLKAPERIGQVESMHAIARCLWALGDAKSQAQARQLWAQLDKSYTGLAETRVRIGTALMAASNKDDKARQQAIDTLELVLKGAPGGTVSAEAAVDLANLYRQAGKFDEAQKTLNFVGKYLAKENLGRLEITDADAEPFRKMATKLLDRLKYDRDAGREPFEKAEALRKTEKFTEAAKAYQAIIQEFAESPYALRSQVALGHCLVGLDKPYAAAEHWKKFIAAAPAGPWRGQADIALMDLYLQRLLDPPEAAKAAEMARQAVTGALTDSQAGESWKLAAPDLFVRVGLVKMAQGQTDAAAEAFTQALPSAPKERQESLNRLLTAAKARQPLLPEDLIAANKPLESNKVALRLALVVLDHSLGLDALAQEHLDQFNEDKSLRMAAAEAAFAAFLQGFILDGTSRDPDQAVKFLQAGTQTYPNGSWQDESFYLLARRLERQADRDYATQIRNDTTHTDEPRPRPAIERERERQQLDDARKRNWVKSSTTKTVAVHYNIRICGLR